PRVDGDYNCDGTTDVHTDNTVRQWWRNGYAAFFALMDSLYPAGGLNFGNVADWWGGPITGLEGFLSGSAMESTIGQTYSLEHSSWVTMMNYYQIVMNGTRSPSYNVFGHDLASATNYQEMRYGFASCLLGNAYYFPNIAGGSSAVTWFDEFDAPFG